MDTTTENLYSALLLYHYYYYYVHFFAHSIAITIIVFVTKHRFRPRPIFSCLPKLFVGLSFAYWHFLPHSPTIRPRNGRKGLTADPCLIGSWQWTKTRKGADPKSDWPISTGHSFVLDSGAGFSISLHKNDVMEDPNTPTYPLNAAVNERLQLAGHHHGGGQWLAISWLCTWMHMVVVSLLADYK